MDARVTQELEAFVAYINTKTGITNSSDYNRCADLFERLRDARVPFDTEEIRLRLIEMGHLEPQDAAAVKKMADKIQQGKRIKRR
jgi:hypothetical protein